MIRSASGLTRLTLTALLAACNTNLGLLLADGGSSDLAGSDLAGAGCAVVGGQCVAGGQASCPAGTIDDTTAHPCENGERCCLPLNGLGDLAVASGDLSGGSGGDLAGTSCGGDRMTCCFDRNVPCSVAGEACFGSVSFEGRSYPNSCWACEPSGCVGCGGSGQPCCVIVGAHHVCQPGLTCPSDQFGGNCQ